MMQLGSYLEGAARGWSAPKNYVTKKNFEQISQVKLKEKKRRERLEA